MCGGGRKKRPADLDVGRVEANILDGSELVACFTMLVSATFLALTSASQI
jgi:hypothetical protein